MIRQREQGCGARGFSLIELLTVISIIAILAAILFPVFARARESARKATCQSNLMQLGLAVHLYAQDYQGRFPREDNRIYGPLMQYMKNDRLLCCPSDSGSRYAPETLPPPPGGPTPGPPPQMSGPAGGPPGPPPAPSAGAPAGMGGPNAGPTVPPQGAPHTALQPGIAPPNLDLREQARLLEPLLDRLPSGWRTSYLYRGGLCNDGLSTAPIAADYNPGQHMEGRNVLRLDCSVKWFNAHNDIWRYPDGIPPGHKDGGEE